MNISKLYDFTETAKSFATDIVIKMNEMLPGFLAAMDIVQQQIVATTTAMEAFRLNTREAMIEFIRSQLGDEINYNDWSDARVQAAYEELQRREDGDGGNFAAVL